MQSTFVDLDQAERRRVVVAILRSFRDLGTAGRVAVSVRLGLAELDPVAACRSPQPMPGPTAADLAGPFPPIAAADAGRHPPTPGFPPGPIPGTSHVPDLEISPAPNMAGMVPSCCGDGPVTRSCYGCPRLSVVGHWYLEIFTGPPDRDAVQNPVGPIAPPASCTCGLPLDHHGDVLCARCSAGVRDLLRTVPSLDPSMPYYSYLDGVGDAPLEPTGPISSAADISKAFAPGSVTIQCQTCGRYDRDLASCPYRGIDCNLEEPDASFVVRFIPKDKH